VMSWSSPKTCTRTERKSATTPWCAQCLGTFALPQGQITGQALLHLPSHSAVDVAITGGSGAYNGAGGFVHTVPAGTTERHLTFHITR
jgi:hypothetical protein